MLSHTAHRRIHVCVDNSTFHEAICALVCRAGVFHASCQVLDLLELSDNSCLSFGKYAMNESKVKPLLMLEGHKGLWAMQPQVWVRSSREVVTHGNYVCSGWSFLFVLRAEETPE